MAANNFSSDIPDAVIAQITALLVQIETAIAPYAVSLTEDQKKHLAKISDKTLPFAEKTDAYLDSNPQFSPPYIDVAETHKDFKNYQKIHPIMIKTDGLKKTMNDIGIAAGSDAYVQFQAYYSSVQKASQQGVTGAKTIFDELAKRYPGHKKTVPPVVPPVKP